LPSRRRPRFDPCRAGLGILTNEKTRWNAGAIHSRDPVTRLAYLLVIVICLPLARVALFLAALDLRVALLSLTSTVCAGSFGLLASLLPRAARGCYFPRFVPYLLFVLCLSLFRDLAGSAGADVRVEG
jgi:hypothetical protein